MIAVLTAVVWHFCRSSDATKLERIQERALRALYCDNKSTYEELLHRAKLPTRHTRRLQAISILMYAWRLPTLRTYLSLPILSIILEIMISSFLDFGLFLMANTA